MPPERITLSRKVREYFAEIGKRGGQAGRRELTRQQAKLLVRLVIALVAIGFPIALIIAWAFELTPEGIKRTTLWCCTR